MKDRIKNIQQHEETLDKAEALLSELEALAREWQQLFPNYIKLIEYYQSEQWIEDYESSNKGEFSSIKHGVLSQDAIYNLISSVKEISILLMKTGMKGIEM